MNNPIEALRHSRYGVPISREEHAEFQRAVTPHAPTTQRSDGTYLNETAQRMFYLWLHAVDWALGACVRGVLQPAASPAPSAKQEPSEGWREKFDELLSDYAGACSETAVFNVTQKSGMTVRMARPRYNKLVEFVEALAAPSASASPAAPGFVLVPVEPITGERYENGEWSRRNWEAALADQGAAPVAGSQQVPEGWKLVAVSPEFDNLMYWMDRCENKGDLSECLQDSWVKFEFVEASRLAAAPAVPVPVEQGWISVEDRLPGVGQTVVFVAKAQGAYEYLNGRVLGGKYTDGGFSTPGLVVDASHWMPLPAAPSLQQGKEGAAS